jgi:hypothetical protein
MKLTPQDHATAVAAVNSYRAHILDLTLHFREIIPASVEALDDLAEYLDEITPARGSLAVLGTHTAESLLPALLWFGRNAAEAALALVTAVDTPVTVNAGDALDFYHDMQHGWPSRAGVITEHSAMRRR